MPRKKAPATPPAPPLPTFEPDMTQTPRTRGQQEVFFWFQEKIAACESREAIFAWLQRTRLSALYETRRLRKPESVQRAAGMLDAAVKCEKQLIEAYDI